MKNLLRFLTATALILVLTAGQGWGQIAAYSGEISPSATAITNATATALSFGSGVSGTGTSSFNSTGWSQGTITDAIDDDDYIQWSIAADGGYTVTVTSIEIDYDRSNTGPSQVSIRTSIDNYATDIFTDASVSSSGEENTISSLSLVSADGGTISFRLYGYNAGSASGTFDIEDDLGTTLSLANIGIILSGSVDASSGGSPTISLSETSLSGFTYVEGSAPSSEQSFTVSGADLTNDISIVPPTDYEISTGTGGSFSATNPIEFSPSLGTVTAQTIYVRLKESLAAGGAYTDEDITASSTGATPKTVTCSGSVTSAGGGGCASDLIISEVNENGNEKYLEIANFTGASVSLADYDIAIYSNGNTTFSVVDLTDASSIADQDVWVLAYDDASAWTGTPDQETHSFNPNGNDVIALRKNSTNIDVFGTIGSDAYYYNDKTVIRNSDITDPTTTYSASDWTFTAYTGGDPATLGSHTMDCGGTAPDNPTAFAASASSTSQIDLTWTENGDGNDVLIAWSSDGTFGDPVDGTSYAASASIPGGGTSLGTDDDGAFSHTSLTSNTPYYYKIWSVDGSTNYSSGVEENATTFADEPSSHPTGLGATANSSSEITVSWTEPVLAPEHYLIKGSTVSYGDISDPVDGTAEINSTLVQNIDAATAMFQFTGLNPSTPYYFQIYSYNGSGTTVNYKLGVGSEQQADAETEAYSGPALLISEVADPKDTYQARFIELYNASASSIDLTGWQIRRYAGTSITSSDVDLSGTINSGETFVVAYNAVFNTSYGLVPDMINGFISGNGDDTYELFDGSDVIDIYGEVGGSDVAWNYEDSKAVRKNTVTAPNTTWTAAEWTIVPDCDAARMTPAMHPASAWNGNAAKSNVWTTAENWDNGLTGSGISAHIPSGMTNYPTLTANATIEDLRMGNGATLVGGAFLTLEGSATVQKNMVGYTGADDGYNIVASPLNGAALLDSDWAPVSGEDDFYVYDPATDIWRNYLDITNPSTWFDFFDVGQGYLAAYNPSNDGIKNIVATTLNSNLTYTFNLVFYATNSHNWNFVGNPYPSKIEFDGMVFSNAGSMKTIDITDGSYDDVASGDDIDICQGFIVYANSDPATVAIDRTDQTHSSAKKAGGEINRMKLIASSPERMVHVWLAVNETSTTNFEWQTDSRYLPPITDLPRLSMLTSDDIEVSTNSFSITGESAVIPVKFSVLQDGTITFSLEDFSNTLGVKDVILEDQLENTFTTLSDGDTFTYDAFTSDDPLRFKLHVNGASSINDPASSDWMNIYSAGSTIYLNSNKAQDATVNVYNNLGQIVASKQLTVDGLTSFDVNAQTGWYVVRVVADGNAVAKKVFIN